MKPGRTTTRGAIFVALSWAFFSPVLPSAAADYRQSYLEGRRALKTKQWAEAAVAFAAAAAERSTEQARARLVGAIPEPYLPYHHLGVSYFRLGRCREALAAFEVSATQGVASTLATYAAEAEAMRADCRERIEADIPAAALAPPTPGPGAAESGSPLEPETAPAPTPAESRAPEARTAAPQQPPSEVSTGGTARRAPTAVLPPALLAAIEAYFAGSYQTTVDLLAERRAETLPEARFLTDLLLGAARYALYLLSREQTTELKTAAEADLDAAHRQRPTFRPSETHFSPRFVRFYNQRISRRD